MRISDLVDARVGLLGFGLEGRATLRALRRKGREWYEGRFIPRISPITLYGLLFTIVLLFAIQGDTITSQPLDVVMIAVPLLFYFAGMWVSGFVIGRLIGLPYAQTASLAFTVRTKSPSS